MQGVLLDERFRIGYRLGAGAMGQVWSAQDERMRRDVAVKVVHPQYGMDEAETQARFQREVQLAGRLSHQNIVTVHDWGEVSVDGRPTLFLVMELVQGVPLHKRLKEIAPAPWPLAVGWAAQIAEALHAAHRQGVVHRDIKPANALLTPDGTVKVLDFGVAKFMGETIGARELTVTGTPVGSPSYMSPEQADGDKTIDHRTDLYSLGCLLYHSVTGRPPFTGTSQWAVLRKQMQDTPEPPASRVEGLPVPLNDLILNLLAKRPGDRPADAAAVYEALSTLLADHAVTEPGGSILDVTQLGHSHSVSGRILKRAWELFQWTEWNRAAHQEAAEAQLTEAAQERERAREESEELLASTRYRVEEAQTEAVRLVEEADRRALALMSAAEQHAQQEAAKAAEELVVKAQADANELRRSATADSEKVRTEAIERATTLRRQAEETLERTRAEVDRFRAEAVAEAEKEAERLRTEAASDASASREEAGRERERAREQSEELLASARKRVEEAQTEAVRLVEEADRRASEMVSAAEQHAQQVRDSVAGLHEQVQEEITGLRSVAEHAADRTRREAQEESDRVRADAYAERERAAEAANRVRREADESDVSSGELQGP